MEPIKIEYYHTRPTSALLKSTRNNLGPDGLPGGPDSAFGHIKPTIITLRPNRAHLNKFEPLAGLNWAIFGPSNLFAGQWSGPV
jgi:hypothetical protein